MRSLHSKAPFKVIADVQNMRVYTNFAVVFCALGFTPTINVDCGVDRNSSRSFIADAPVENDLYGCLVTNEECLHGSANEMLISSKVFTYFELIGWREATFINHLSASSNQPIFHIYITRVPKPNAHKVKDIRWFSDLMAFEDALE